MALVNKIREKSGLAVGVVAVGLILFIVGGDMFFGNNSIFFADKQNVGEIGGSTVKLKDYQAEIEVAERDYTLQQNKTPTEAERSQLREQAWNQLIQTNAVEKHYEAAGIMVTEDEVVDMVQGNNIHPAIRQAFVNPQTNQFDVTMVKQYLKNFDKLQPLDRFRWENFESRLPQDRMRTKYEALFKSSNYVTKAEAQREYQGQATKAEVKFLYVPFSMVVDSTIKVSDDELKAYLDKNKEKYKTQPTRTIEYVQFRIEPNAKDSAFFLKELEETKAQFASATNDTAFAKAKSDVPSVLRTYAINELPAELSAQAGAIVTGQVYGPYANGGSYALYKVLSVSNEGAFSARASHILFDTRGKSDDEKKEVKAKAEGVLKEIKGGADFAEKARTYGSDGTAPQGGDLGWFPEGRMVPAFEKAIFSATKKGLSPNLVETEFGYHIVKITEPKTNQKFKVVTIQRNITAGDETKDEIYARASQFRVEITNADALAEAIKKTPTLSKMVATVQPTSYNVNDIQDARGLVRWAFNDAKVGDAADLQEFTDRYVVAVLTKSQEEGTASLDEVRDAITAEVRKQKKAEQIIAKLGGNGSLEDLAKQYPGAIVNTAPDVTMSGASIAEIGYDPAAVGRAFGLKKDGDRTKPFAGESGVIVLSRVKVTPAAEIADYNMYKSQIEQRVNGRVSYSLFEAIKDLAKIKDERIKFF